MKIKPFFLSIVLLLIFSYLLISQVKAAWLFTIDDMYISLRYARHWAEGSGILWNLGQPPVEGYSNFTFVALATLAIRLHLDPVIVLKAAGVLGLYLSTLAIYCISRLWFSFWMAFIPCIWMLLYKGQIFWSVSGLETTIYQALICFSVFFILRGMGYKFYPVERNAVSWLSMTLAGCLFALAGLTRPEAPALIILFYSLAVFDNPQLEKTNYYKGLLLSGIVLACIYFPYFLWRWSYFEKLFPNAIYCKGFTLFSEQSLNKNYLYLAWPFFLLSLPAIWSSKDKRHYFLWSPSLVYLCLLIGADPIVAFANRLFLPAFVLLLPLSLQGIVVLLDHLLVKKDWAYYACLLVISMLIIILAIPSLSLTNYYNFSINPQVGIQLREKVSDWLKHHVKPGSQVVLADSGLIPYKSKLHFVDSYCLNNRNMTQPPRNIMYQRLCEEVVFKKPNVIILTSLIDAGRIIYSPADQCLHDKLQLNANYQFRIAYQTTNEQSQYRYEIYTLAKQR